MEWLKIFAENKQLLGESADMWCDIPDCFKRHILSKDQKIHAVFDFVRLEKAKLKPLIKDLAIKFGLQEVFTATNRRTEFASFILGNNEMCAIFSTNGDSGKQHVEYSFDLFSSNHSNNLEIRDFIRALHTDTKQTPEVYCLTNSGHGYGFSSLGEEPHVLEPDNYNKETIEKFDHMISDLGSDNPCGKFSLLEGPPGTGKSFLLRALINRISQETDCLCCVIPPYLTSSLGDPSLVGTFIAQKSDNKNRKIILILEDSDDVIITRASDNMAKISSLLNITDGIIGGLLNIRIIATTNQVNEMDPALARPGRMCSRIHIGSLGREKATEVFKRITDGKLKAPSFDKNTVLADVYKAALFPEIKDDIFKRASVGFKTEES